MKKITKHLIGILISIILLFTNIDSLKASSANISVSSSASTVVIGNTFTVTIKISSSSDLGAWDFTPSYDSSKFKMTSGDASVADYGPTKSKSYTYKFKAIGTGSGTITVKSYGAFDYDENKMSVSVSSKTVKVITQAEQKASYSKNNNLKNLYIEGLELSPSFSNDVTEYKAEANPNTTTIKIIADADDSRAEVAGSGDQEVEEGENKFTIRVTAQNGDSKNYTIIVNVVDPNPIEVTIENEKYKVVKREVNLEIPDNYEKTTIKINDQDIPALFSELNKYILVGLKDSKGNISSFVYNKENNTYKKYEEIKLSQMKIYPLSIDKTFSDNDRKEQIIINDITFEAVKTDNNDFYIIHARDLNTGEDDYYKYDKETNTMVRYYDETSSYKKEIVEYKRLIMILSGESVLIIFILICILISNMIKNKKRKKELKEQSLLEAKEEKTTENIDEDNKELKEKDKKEEIVKKKKINTNKNKKKKEVLKDEKDEDNQSDN